MAEIQPRYEFRVWAENLAELRQKLERRATPTETTSRETYLISRITDRCSAKIRSDLMDIKLLISEHRRLEQWKPVLKEAFPLDGSIIASRIFPSLEIRPPQLSRPQYAMEEFFNEVIRVETGIAIAEVSKTRFKFNLDASQAEFTVVTLNDMARHTVAMESTNPDVLLRLIHEFSVEGMENISYVRQIKRTLGLG